MSEGPDPLDNIREAIRGALDERVREVQDELQRRWSDILTEALDRLNEPLPLEGIVLEPPEASPGESSTGTPLLDAIQQLSATEDQVSLLNLLVRASAAFAGRSALFVIRQEQAVGWTAVGFRGDEAEQEIRHVALPLSGDSPLAESVARRSAVQQDGGAGTDGIWEALQAEPSGQVVVLPLSVQERVVGVLFCDAGPADGTAPLALEALQVLVQFAQAHLNSLRGRTRTVSRAAAPGVERRPSQAWEPPQVEAGTMEMAGAIEPAVEPEPSEVPSAPAPPPAGAEDAHEEARRFARLLVSEVLLYNEARVEEGRENRDIYARLREDLERSEQMYRQRAPADVVEDTDYFHEEVLRTLANGDPELLGSR